MTHRKKLIEVNIPLQAINIESAKDGALKHGHPSTLHRYWARRPLAACRAIVFASFVDDPAECEDEFTTEDEQDAERDRLYDIIKRLIIWKNSNDANLLAEARYEIALSVARNNGQDLTEFRAQYKGDPEAVLQYLREHAPAVYDPFCGGGSVPLEAQRLGLNARGSDLNPLPVLLNKAMIELPPKFHNQQPVNPEADPMHMFTDRGKSKARAPWRGTAGLAADIRYYGAWMREAAYKRIGHLYPKAELPDGTSATVVAWLWARTVLCINPACGLQIPLIKTFQLSKKKGQEQYIKPVVERETNTISWHVQTNPDGLPAPTVMRTGAYCCGCGTAAKLPYLREQGKAGRMGERMTAIVAEGERRKLFLAPAEAHVQIAQSAEPSWRPRGTLPTQGISISPQLYGFINWHQLFTERQLTALNTFSGLLAEVHKRMREDGAENEYADAVSTYLSLAIDKTAESHCSFAWWQDSVVRTVFTSHRIQMTWSFAEANPFSTSTQNWMAQIEWVSKAVENLPAPVNPGEAHQADVCTTPHAQNRPVVITDPPYYDNIGFADLSDFFYVWLRPLLRNTYPELFAGMTTPKAEEITAIPRFENPKQHFEDLLSRSFRQVRRYCSDKYPTSIFYAYKQREKEQDGKTSTGWETMLEATINAGFQIVATWPLRTEVEKGQKTGKNTLTSSILLVCRPRPEDASRSDRNAFIRALEHEMPAALDRLTRIANIRPVDLAQAAIGPGMEIYSRYRSVTRMSGEVVSIREALLHINNAITAYHEKVMGQLDTETQFCLTWLRQHGYSAGSFGDAEALSKAKGVHIEAMHDTLLLSSPGSVRLLRSEEYADREERREMSSWEGCLRMAWHLSHSEFSGGIQGCARVARLMRDYDGARRLALILYSHYEALGDTETASQYNYLVTEWTYIYRAMGSPVQIEADV